MNMKTHELIKLAKFDAETLIGRGHAPRISAPNTGAGVWALRKLLDAAGQVCHQTWHSCCRAWVNPAALLATADELRTVAKFRNALDKIAKNNTPKEAKKTRSKHENEERKLRHKMRTQGREILRNGGPTIAVFRAGWKSFPTVVPAVSSDECEVVEMSTKRCAKLIEALEHTGEKYNAVTEIAVPHPHRDLDWRRQVLHYWVPCVAVAK